MLSASPDTSNSFVDVVRNTFPPMSSNSIFRSGSLQETCSSPDTGFGYRMISLEIVARLMVLYMQSSARNPWELVSGLVYTVTPSGLLNTFNTSQYGQVGISRSELKKDRIVLPIPSIQQSNTSILSFS